MKYAQMGDEKTRLNGTETRNSRWREVRRKKCFSWLIDDKTVHSFGIFRLSMGLANSQYQMMFRMSSMVSEHGETSVCMKDSSNFGKIMHPIVIPMPLSHYSLWLNSPRGLPAVRILTQLRFFVKFGVIRCKNTRSIFVGRWVLDFS